MSIVSGVVGLLIVKIKKCLMSLLARHGNKKCMHEPLADRGKITTGAEEKLQPTFSILFPSKNKNKRRRKKKATARKKRSRFEKRVELKQHKQFLFPTIHKANNIISYQQVHRRLCVFQCPTTVWMWNFYFFLYF